MTKLRTAIDIRLFDAIKTSLRLIELLEIELIEIELQEHKTL